jgi:hypothetical protein
MGIGDGLGAIPTARLGEDAVHVGLDRGLTDEEVPPDLGVGTPSGNQSEDFGFSLGQTVGQVATLTSCRAWTTGSSTAWPEAAASRARPMWFRPASLVR